MHDMKELRRTAVRAILDADFPRATKALATMLNELCTDIDPEIVEPLVDSEALCMALGEQVPAQVLDLVLLVNEELGHNEPIHSVDCVVSDPFTQEWGTVQ